MTFIIAGILVISSESPSMLTFRKVMVILSIVFAVFMFFGAFIVQVLIHAGIDYISSLERNLRVTQGFCAIFELVLSVVTLCQTTSDQEGQVIAQGPQTILTIQPGVQQGVHPSVGYATATFNESYLQASANPQNFVRISTNPPPYSQLDPSQLNHKS